MQFDIVGKAVRILKLPTVNYDNHTIKVVPAQVGDVNSRFFEVHLYDDRGEIPFSQYNELYLGVTLPDDSVEYSVGEIDGDIGYVKLLSSMLQEAGRLKCSVMLRGQDDNKEEVWLTSQTFYVTVLSSSVFDESQAGNDDDYNLLLGLIKDVEDLEENIETAEAARVEAENKRVEAEKGRVSSENQRVENENKRIENENARKSAESARVTAEQGRVKAEQARVSAENARDAAEDQRVENENERISNENTRKSAESARESAEDARVKAEQGRVTAEQGRVSAENARDSAEDVRIENEKDRVEAENTRNSNEDTRKSNETARQNAETGRVNAEKNRVSAETARESAEDERERAEADREDAEADRVAAETGRVNAEKGRVTAEQGRVTAEQGRVTAENNRVTEFNEKIQECEDATAAAQEVVDEAQTLGITGTVKFDRAQDLTDTQEAQARNNIGAAPLASPTFTGTPKAPSPATTDDSTRIATTAYVRDVIPTIKVNNATQADKDGEGNVISETYAKKSEVGGGGATTIGRTKPILQSYWKEKTWSGVTSISGAFVWTDGENIYYSNASSQYVLDKATSTWTEKTWNGLTNFRGDEVWTDGENIYYSYAGDKYVLDKATSTWTEKTWNGLTPIDGAHVWTDGESIYYSSFTTQYVLDKATSTWMEKTWNGLSSFMGFTIWTDGENIYYSNASSQYVLDKATSTWTEKTWNGLTSFNGNTIWTDGENIYSSYGSNQYVLDKSTSTWTEKTWNGGQSNFIDDLNLEGDNVWTDGENIYYNDYNTPTATIEQYVLINPVKTAPQIGERYGGAKACEGGGGEGGGSPVSSTFAVSATGCLTNAAISSFTVGDLLVINVEGVVDADSSTQPILTWTGSGRQHIAKVATYNGLWVSNAIGTNIPITVTVQNGGQTVTSQNLWNYRGYRIGGSLAIPLLSVANALALTEEQINAFGAEEKATALNFIAKHRR